MCGASTYIFFVTTVSSALCASVRTRETFINVRLEAYREDPSSYVVINIARDDRLPQTLLNYPGISIENQTIPTLHRNSVSELSNLRYLELRSNRISVIEPGAFRHLPRLHLLDISRNSLREIPAFVFSRLNVTGLILSHNEIQEIDSRSFNNMPNLEYLDLSHNNIETVQNYWFEGCPELVELNLAFNKITQITGFTFQHLKKEGNEYYYNSRYPSIILSNNKISTLHDGAFSGLEEIWEIRLDNNSLRNINSDAFEDVYKVHHLNVSYNKLSCLSDLLLEKLERTTEIYLSGNGLNEKCIRYISSWSKTHGVKTII